MNLKFVSLITSHFQSIFMIRFFQNPAFHAEFSERRIELDRALICCNKLQDELQYIAETLPADKKNI